MLGILCGLESEAVIARNIKNAIVVCAGARPENARTLARELVQKGAKRLISFGVAGGLQTGLPLGALIIGSHIMSPNGKWDCDMTYAQNLKGKLSHAHIGGVWGSEILVPTAGDKKELHQKSGCMIVDMESQCAAEVAAEAKLPLAVVRSVCDSATMDVPDVLMVSINPDGHIDYLRAAWHVIRHPLEIPDLFHVSRGLNRGLGALKDSVEALSA
jgi:hypothetical protein